MVKLKGKILSKFKNQSTQSSFQKFKIGTTNLEKETNKFSGYFFK